MTKSKKTFINGKVLTAILSGGIGSFLLGLYTFAANRNRYAKQDIITTKSVNTLKIGKALAAILSGGIGCFFLGLFAFLAGLSKTMKDWLTFFPLSGPLSGSSTLAIIGWLVSWIILHFTWKDRKVEFSVVFIIGVALIGIGLLFMFPPFIEVFKLFLK